MPLFTAAAAEVAVAHAGGLRAVLAAAGINLSRLELPEPPAEADRAAAAADHAQPAAAGAGSNDGPAAAPAATPAAGASSSSDPGLSAGPDWSWPPELRMLLRLHDYELVGGLLASAKPPLLGRGGAIPPGTLAAFR